MNVGIIGCGYIGRKRALSLPGGARVTMVFDTDTNALGEFCRQVDAHPCGSISEMVCSKSVDLVVVSTPNCQLIPCALEAIQHAKPVLIEKPGALDVLELLKLKGQLEHMRRRPMIRFGYNLRCHRAFRQAKELVDTGAIGRLMMVRGRYGHGGRKGYETEWRSNPKISGGGELIDQGVHLIDLARWFLGEFVTIEGHVCTSFWKMKVDDNAFLSLQTQKGQTAWLHASCTEWKNTFSFEIYGRNGKIAIDGLGGSYGVERCTFHQMLPQMGPPKTVAWEYPMGDDSWEVEMKTFMEDIRLKREPEPGLSDAIATLQVVDRIYSQNKQ